MPRKTQRPSPRRKGDQKERLAEQYLLQQGLKLLVRNFQCKLGEIDLVMQHGDTRVFVEVRYRKSRAFGSAVESVDFRKQQKLIKTAQFYLLQDKDSERLPSRFDVIAIEGDSNTIEWITNAFAAG
ncbi:MAG: YraN family protein [Gammaproteobacteria bacterium]|uniref:YraN family protein n=1 Tax=Pseudomaricurvus alcaniphilus TaxID=1166482 RepID=UPI00140C40EA|nr:YraN family protein [Pseudomaricurvus alcaniphilus]MBR9909088.1 YraN family protein [Gammaproteobacteria bacterium]NHN38133.1 YraN family protein [Pseudomaricurvus alcaniphilus]